MKNSKNQNLFNRIGISGMQTISSFSQEGVSGLTVDGGDALATRFGLFGGPAMAESRFDHNRNGRGDVRDLAVVRENQGASLVRLGQPALAQAVAPPAITGRTARRRTPYVLY